MTAFLVTGCGKQSVDLTTSTTPSTSRDENTGKADLLIDVTKEAGIDFTHDAFRRGEFLFPEINGAGCGFLDYDNDGFLDIYLIQSGKDLKDPNAIGSPNRLYHNLGDGTFEDVTEQSGAGDTGYGQGFACGDYNGDGFVDIYVANVGGPSSLLSNNGDGTFANVTEKAGVANGRWAITPAFLDYNNDGHLDLFASNYVDWTVEKNIAGHTKSGQPDYTGPRSYPATSSVLFHNNGDGTFRDRTHAAGIDKTYGAAMGILCVDVNDDDLVDIYVANDSWANQLWINQGDGTFKDRALDTACALNGTGHGLASMGPNAEDLNGDGRLDLFTTNYHAQGAILYLSGANGIFTDASMRTKLFGLTAAKTGFGACFLDLFNNDSPCVYIGNGAAVMGGELGASDSYAQKDTILEWSPSTQAFADISEKIGPAINAVHTSRGVAVGDYDNDGAIDVLVSSNNGPARLLKNTAADGNWLKVRCMTADGKSDAIGAKVFVTVDGKTRRRDVVINYSYGSTCDPRIHFGLGHNTKVECVVVRWPGGKEAVWENVAANQLLEVTCP